MIPSYLSSIFTHLCLNFNNCNVSYAELRPGHSQASKINLFARIVNVIKLTLLTIYAKSNIMDI